MSIPVVGKFPKEKLFLNTPQSKPSEVINASAPKQKNSHLNELLIGGISALGIIGLSGVVISQRGVINNINKTIHTGANETLIPYKILPLKKTQLYESFVASGESFLKFIENTNSTPKQIKEFLFGITANKHHSVEFIQEAISNPRESAQHLNMLKNKIGGWKNLSEWLQAPKGYQEAYNKYFSDNVKKMNIDEMIKLSPNWHLYYLMQKSDNNLQFGKLPEEFQKLGDYPQFINWITALRQELKQGTPIIKEYNNQLMEISSLKTGLSGKLPIKIKFLNSPKEKTYVIKIQQTWGVDNHNIAKEGIAYRADSTFINAQVDYYLNLHSCENTIPFYYFDYKSDSAIYEFIEGAKGVTVNNILEGNKLLKDLNLLGIHCNDVHAGNILSHQGQNKVIDIGDCTFIDPLRPGILGHNFEFENGCGISAPNFALALKL